MANLYSQAKALLTGPPDAGAGATANNVAQYKAAYPDKPVKAAPAAPTTASPQDKVNPAAKYGDRPGEKRIDTKKLAIGSFKKGGKVKKTGLYKLHKGERVVKSKTAKKLDAMGGLRTVLGGKA